MVHYYEPVCGWLITLVSTIMRNLDYMYGNTFLVYYELLLFSCMINLLFQSLFFHPNNVASLTWAQRPGKTPLPPNFPCNFEASCRFCCFWTNLMMQDRMRATSWSVPNSRLGGPRAAHGGGLERRMGGLKRWIDLITTTKNIMPSSRVRPLDVSLMVSPPLVKPRHYKTRQSTLPGPASPSRTLGVTFVL